VTTNLSVETSQPVTTPLPFTPGTAGRLRSGDIDPVLPTLGRGAAPEANLCDSRPNAGVVTPKGWGDPTGLSASETFRTPSKKGRRGVKNRATSQPFQTDWDRVDRMKDEEIDLSDLPAVPPEKFARAVVRKDRQPLAPKPLRPRA
jgi:hypothetical protein